MTDDVKIKVDTTISQYAKWIVQLLAIVIVVAQTAISLLQPLVTQSKAVVVQPVNPTPIDKTIDEQPQEDPPLPTPIGPLAVITVTDCALNPLVGDASPGQMLIFSAEKSLHGNAIESIRWTVTPPLQTTQSRDGKTFILTTSTEEFSTFTVQQIVALEDKAAYSSLTIKSGKAPMPPPDVDSVPEPDEDKQKSIQKVDRVRVSIVVDYQNLSTWTCEILNDRASWDAIRAAGNDVLLFDDDAKEKVGVAALEILKAAKVAVPGIVIQDPSNGSVLHRGPLVSADQAAALIKGLVKS